MKPSFTLTKEFLVLLTARACHNFGMHEPRITSGNAAASDLDQTYVRQQFPALRQHPRAFFDNAAGSLACRHTIDALHAFYLESKVQPGSRYEESELAASRMQRSLERWSEALGVAPEELSFGPSTSMNSYVLANAFASTLGAGDEVVVTNQDHEANTGGIRRSALSAGASIREWRTDPVTGLLDINELEAKLSPRTKLVCFPHASNLIGQENDVATICSLAQQAGARTIVDGVSFAPHGIPDVSALGADIYLFSLYKTFSVHQGLMVTRHGVMEELPHQGHYFTKNEPGYRLAPAGADHAQVAAAGGVLNYIEDLHQHHGGQPDDLWSACRSTADLWRNHERRQVEHVLGALADLDVRVLGASSILDDAPHRCPTIAFDTGKQHPDQVADALIDRGVLTASGSFYANRVLDGVGIDPDRGVVRLSWVHYTSDDEIDLLVDAITTVLTTP